MKFIELAKKRVSVRTYKPEPVSDELLNEVLEAGRLAPTACNLQPFQFVVVREKENLAALAAGYPNEKGRPKIRQPIEKLVRYETWKN